MIDPFLSPKLKLERAKTHVMDLHRAARLYRESNPYSGVAEADQHTEQLVYKLRIHKPVPAEFSVMIGDAVQNLRSALDHAACCLAIQRDRSVNINDVSFPIARNAEEFKSKAKKSIRKLSPDAKAYIAALKPYQGGNDLFWRLHRLGVKDRHQVISPVWAARGSIGIRFNMPSHSGNEESKKIQTPYTFINPADRFEPLQDGSELFRKPLVEDDHIDDEIRVNIDIAFGDDDVVVSEPIGPALIELGKFVGGVLAGIERQFFS